MAGWVQRERAAIAAEVLGELSNLLFLQLFLTGKVHKRPRVRKPPRPFVMLGGPSTRVISSLAGQGGTRKAVDS